MASSKKSLSGWSILALVVLGLLALLGLFLYFQWKKKREEILDMENPPEPLHKEATTDEEKRLLEHYVLISKTLQSEGINNGSLAPLFVAQGAHESGNFTSRLYSEQNNLFGMRQPVERQTLSVGEQQGYATFNSKEDSVKDLLLWFAAKQIPIDLFTTSKDGIKEYANVLKEHKYFTASITEYRSGMNHYMGMLKPLLSAG